MIDRHSSQSADIYWTKKSSSVYLEENITNQYIPVPDQDFYAALMSIECTFEDVRSCKNKAPSKKKISNNEPQELVINNNIKKNKLLRELESSILQHLEDLMLPVPPCEYGIRFIKFPTPLRELVYSTHIKNTGNIIPSKDEEELLFSDEIAAIRARKLRSQVLKTVERNFRMMEYISQRLLELTTKEHILLYPRLYLINNSLNNTTIDNIITNFTKRRKRKIEVEAGSSPNSLQSFQENVRGTKYNLLEKINLLQDTISVIGNSQNMEISYRNNNKDG